MKSFALPALLCTCLLSAGYLAPQTPAPPPRPTPGRGLAIVSPQIEPDGRVTFRVLAPMASVVTIGGEINQAMQPSEAPAPAPVPGTPPSRPGPAVTLTKGENGVWSGTTPRPLKPGAWRYAFNVDGATVVDSRNVKTSPSQTQLQSLLEIPGDFSETRNVPHGALSQVRYVASTLNNATRQMVVYTPPGYEKDNANYPVLYLIHGGGDTAESWSTVGRANDIMDNLIAEKKALPMIVVMPSGWTPSGGQVMTSDATKDPFNDEMLKDIIPYMQNNFRALATPGSRALSGLSMGGIQTLNIGLHNLGTFSYIAVMSSGWISEPERQFFYTSEAAKIPTYNSNLKLFWWGWGQTDIARENGLRVMEKFKSEGVKIETLETPGGHEWANWRIYLHEVAPKLFR